MKMQSAPLIEEFQLKSDPSGEASVTIRQAREGEHIERSQLFAKTNRVYSDDLIGEVKLETEYNQRKLRRKEAYLTLATVSGIYEENDKGERKEWFASGETADGPSVKARMSEHEFNHVWGKLPPEVAKEISELVRQVNPTWNPEALGESIGG